MHLLVIPWDVNPEIFRIGHIAVRWYGLLFVSAFLLGYIIMNMIFKNENLGKAVLDRLTIIWQQALLSEPVLAISCFTNLQIISVIPSRS